MVCGGLVAVVRRESLLGVVVAGLVAMVRRGSLLDVVVAGLVAVVRRGSLGEGCRGDSTYSAAG